ncbi:uncharacterized protein PHACADRAFT_260391 [Phanerochaete carnosa HHB-10118-sp]|uniref:DUF7514 domain-containing protein n=1 Tax=Phanerochaete carnosa (strain HHB-10118-sp) TaxID=650164 RepID=K5WTV1_PHACS|nr:uncharacterized protein PHACADRAFT_260391 [Phanerochaete carnosa HHB-10118-sp]EKM53842.1 hypothetical protein PHACADRAFT_260391 [Phanerochaete carnosa HHB-10118-sp]
MPVLDRRGWLRLAVFEARAAPEEAHRHWNKVLALFALTDPSTRTPFPTPLPRSALPAFADPSWRAVYVRWRMQAIAAASRARVTSALRPHSMRAAGAGFGASATGLRYAGFRHARHASGSESGGGDHATVLDTVNTFGTLANTLIGATTGGGGGNSAFGSAGGLFGAGLSGSGFGGTGF